MTPMQRLRGYVYRQLLQPQSGTEDTRRRELILNVLLAGLTLASLVALVTTTIDQLTIHGLLAHMTSLLITAAFCVVVVGLWYLSRLGYYQIGLYALVGVVWLGATNLVVAWSIDLPGAELTYALSIIIAGVLISSRAGLIVAALSSVVVVVAGYGQAMGLLHPMTSWLKYPVEVGDGVGFAVIFWIIGLVSWLANREIDKSLRRARISEEALRDERDNLEERVVQRTRQLEQTQLERMLELQRFAEFGRLAAGLLHDVANPLTAASLNLEQLGSGKPSKVLQEATQSLHHLERYIEAARKQLQNESQVRNFAVGDELDQVVSILAHNAEAAGVTITMERAGNYRLFGDPVKFSQLAANLIANAIESYGALPKSAGRSVRVKVGRSGATLVMEIHDHGIGIDASDMPRIFTPFYSTKRSGERSIGIGLAMVERIVATDFKGTITVTSTPKAGTHFIARLHSGRPSKPQA
jgi:signal transduction histidine kinase